MEEEKDIYRDTNAGELNLNENDATGEIYNEEENDELAEEDEITEPEIEVMVPEIEPEDPDVFYIRSSQGISINGCGMQRGKYKLGDKIYGSGWPITIDENVRDSALSIDAASIASNPHLAE